MEFCKDVPIIHLPLKSNKRLKFTQTDSEEKFYENRKKFGVDWYYYNKDIDYTYNSWGYRTKEFSELNDDYILVFGCSFTEGIGLDYDDIWASKLGKKLNLDVFNLGIGGSGPDTSSYNTILFQNFILKNKKFPKYVVYQWTFENRTSFMIHNEYDSLNIETFSVSYPKDSYPKNHKKYYDWYIHSFIENGGELIKQNNLASMLCNNIWKSMNIPVYHWTWDDDFILRNPEFFNNSLIIEQINDKFEFKGRDVTHNGHLSQDIVVDKILEKIKNDIS
jgi:hypothetical protein